MMGAAGIEKAKGRLRERGFGRIPRGPAKFVGGDETKFHYRALPVYGPDKKRKPEHMLEAARRDLRDREYKPVESGVSCVGIDDAEIWSMDIGLWNWCEAERLRQLAKQSWWMDLQAARSQPGRGFLPEKDQLAE